MYERVMRSPNKSGRPPAIGPEDHARWIQLQKMVELERSEVRKWNASFVRPRLSSHLHPSFKGAMEPKFKRGRDRVVQDYPQYYDFLSTIGLRLPGMPSGSQKEPVLSRMKPEVQPSSAGVSIKGAVSDALRNRGLLARKGKICQVSIARPIWPTDDNGVPIEKEIGVEDSYWKVYDPKVDEVESGDGLKHKDFRRTGHFPKKKKADPVSMDPLVKQFVEEQRVHIALAASTIVTLAKVLPSLASEWEIPVRVVFEEDSKGEKHKRIYIDKPLIQKKMTAMEMTQMFYDGALKKLALDGQPPKDVGILTSVATPPSLASVAPKENTTPKEDITPKEDTTPKEDSIPKENAISKQNYTLDENDSKEITSADNTKSEDPSQEPAVVTSEQGEALADKDKDSECANTANVAGDASATGHGSDADDEVGFLGSSADDNSIDNFEYSLWTFGDIRLLIRDRLHGFLADQKLMRQVVLKAILDYAPEIGPGEPGKSSMAGWWMSTWIRDDRLVALGRVDVSKNQFVRYPTQISENLDFENPLGAVFSDLPALQVLDASQLRLQDRDVGEWIKPSMRLIHYVLGKLMQLGPGQYILGHKRFDVNASIYRAVDVESVESRKAKASSARYDLHAAHQSSPQLLPENTSGGTGGMAEGRSSQNTNGVTGTVVDDDLLLRWIGTSDQIPGTFPYQEPTGGPSIGSEGDKGRQGYQKKRRGGGGGGGSGKRGVATCGAAYKTVPAGQYPDMDCTPFVQDPQVQEWLKLVDFTKVPVYPQSKNGVCPEDKTKIPKDQCWWTCQKCDAPEDITTCPKQKSWGLTYDGAFELMDSYPETLKRAYNEGHHIAIHSDVDARVRNIATQLGFKTSIWTQGYDTNDWLIPAGTTTPQSVIDIFKGRLANFRQLPTGFIVLQHDLFKEEVDVAVEGILPIAYNTADLVMQPIADCLGDGKPYKEGAGTFKLSSDSPSTNPETLDKAVNVASASRPIAGCASLVSLAIALLVSL
ncbi:chitin deacetylase [Podila horticola]|nr:chitin deacetylase [Podila horticola]